MTLEIPISNLTPSQREKSLKSIVIKDIKPLSNEQCKKLSEAIKKHLKNIKFQNG